MTQYENLLWLDSDTLVAESLTLIFEKADRWFENFKAQRLSSQYKSIFRLFAMSDPRPGPRIGMVHDCHYYQHFFDTGTYPTLGLRRDEYSNSGVFLIKPGLYKA